MKHIVLFTLYLLILSNCSQHNRKVVPLFNENNPILEIGSDGENIMKSEHVYKFIERFYIDKKENIYLSNFSEKKIDKFNNNGEFICSFGRQGQGPGEFSDVVGFFAVDSNGNLYASYAMKIMVYNADGSFNKNIYFPERLKKWRVLDIRIDSNDNIYLLFFDRLIFEIIKTDVNFINFVTIHKNNKREISEDNRTVSSALGLFKPDFDFDIENNIYITDNVDYKVYIYSSQGDLITIFDKVAKKIRISKIDLVFPTYRGDEVTILPDSFLSNLTGVHKYFPLIFGVNIDRGKIYIWTAEQDHEYKYIVDIYDLNFTYIGRTSYYNWNIRGNMVEIHNDKFYITNIQSDDNDFKKKISRCAFFNLPYKIQVFQLK